MRLKLLFSVIGVLIILITTSIIAMAPPLTGKKDPLPSSNFVVEIDGIASASYTYVDGVGSDMEVIEYREANDPNNIRLVPGNVRAGPLTLKRGLSENTELWDWYKDTRDNPVVKKSMSVVILDHGHNEKARYNLHGCWPSEYYLEPLESNPSNVAYEVIVIQYESMERA
jgi:phage tail-like protein